MTIWIILFWVVGVGLLVAVAVWRGYKKGPTVFDSSNVEQARLDQMLVEQRAADAARRTEEELKSLRAEIERLSQKLDANQEPSSKKEATDEQDLFHSWKAQLAGLDPKRMDTEMGIFRAQSLLSLGYSPSSDTSVDVIIEQLEVLEALKRNYETSVKMRKFSFDAQFPKAPMLNLPMISK
ncbi:MAG: hypothetical protein ACN6OP_07685 [Pseudomonadales bacterium]